MRGERVTNVNPGSIYHALKKMAAESLLEEVTTDEDARGPGPHRIPAHAGRGDGVPAAAWQGLSESEENVQDAYRFSAAMTFLPALPRARAISLLRHRLTQLEGQRATTRDMLEHGADWGQPAHVNELY